MQKFYFFTLILLLTISLNGCSDSDDERHYAPVSPVKVDLSQVPYPKLSDYKFFEGELKNMEPAQDVLPYSPNSSLFTDYAYKKRFVWMPKDVKAAFNGDENILELPTGAALIKTFYYENVQNVTPVGARRIIETRVMIRKANGWIFANYVWNEDQTEAFYDMAGSFTNVSWTDANGVTKTTDYRIPSEEQCIVCHKSKQIVNGEELTVHVPIGIEPQHLNYNYSYENATTNQLAKWVEVGYLEEGFAMPTAVNTTVDYNDVTKSLDERARSYVDINCAHCHQTDRHCDYRPMRFAFNETANNPTNMGVCVETMDMQDFPAALSKIVTPGNVNRSMLYHRINTTNEGYRMPLHGRTVIHEEGVALLGDWINSLQGCP